MADLHALDKDATGQHQRVAFHFPIPDLPNAAGLSYRTALILSGIGGTTILAEGDGKLGTISAAEKAAIAAGAVFESVESLPPQYVTGDGSLPAKVSGTLLYVHAKRKKAVLAELTARLERYGQTETAK